MKRFEISWEDGNKEFAMYNAVFNFYMKIRDDAEWLYVFDNKEQKYLICENCNCK